MPRSPDPHNLHALSHKARHEAASGVGRESGAKRIESNRACLGCGYNLRGLPLESNCPECGLPSVLPQTIDDPLALMPMGVIALLIRGCWVATICVGIVICVFVLEPWRLWERWISLLALTVAALMWWGAVLWLTPAFSLPQAIVHGFSISSVKRRAARALQVGWVLAAGALLAESLAPNAPASLASFLNAIELGGAIIGLAGFIALCLMLEQLAEWTRDDRAARLFNWAMWGVPAACLLNLVDNPMPFAIYTGILYQAAKLALFLTFPIALISLSGSVTLSILHHLEHRDREHRRQERRREYDEQVIGAVRAMDRVTPSN